MKPHDKNHHFTVVIPTRERCDTLKHSLRTCVIQQYDNLEIIVSDNFSQDRTREVVESYNDFRIRYINTGKRVSMTENFEFALSHVKPEGYVIYIGDDDGLLPNAIRDINAVVNQTGAQVLRWETAAFTWPDSYSDRSSLFISSLRSKIFVRETKAVINNVLSFKESYASLPKIYMQSAISYQVIREIISLSGKFYHSMIPDVYSGFAIAGSVDTFIN
jgi:glycosyltransferase involved in cell wall biosynthesis